MNLQFIDISYQYRLYAFATYRDMQEATSQLKGVVLAKAFGQVKEIEAKDYVEHMGRDGSYRNNLEENPTIMLNQLDYHDL